MTMLLLLTACGFASSATPAGRTTPEITVEGPRKDANDLLVYTVTSPYQYGPNAVEVLLPDKLEKGRRYPVLYILPVNTGTRGRWGSGILEAKRLDLHNQHGLICVAPAFDRIPWYGDHPTDSRIRQESYLLKVVVPLVEKRHPAIAKPSGRLLVGFSKSGWGAFSLLLRHPEVFGRAAAWDAPLAKDKPNAWGMDRIFATQENFENYRITALLDKRAGLLRKGPKRLVLLGYGNFKFHVEQVHRRMLALGIGHHYDNRTKRKHDWRSGWLAGAVAALVRPEKEGKKPATRPAKRPK